MPANGLITALSGLLPAFWRRFGRASERPYNCNVRPSSRLLALLLPAGCCLLLLLPAATAACLSCLSCLLAVPQSRSTACCVLPAACCCLLAAACCCLLAAVAADACCCLLPAAACCRCSARVEVFVYFDVVTCCETTKLRYNLAVVVVEDFVYFEVVTCCKSTKLRCNLAVVVVPTLSLYRDRSNASVYIYI